MAPHLSQIVEPGPAFVQPPEPLPARQLSVCLAAALPLLQRHLYSTLQAAEYQVRQCCWCVSRQPGHVRVLDGLFDWLGKSALR